MAGVCGGAATTAGRCALAAGGAATIAGAWRGCGTIILFAGTGFASAVGCTVAAGALTAGPAGAGLPAGRAAIGAAGVAAAGFALVTAGGEAARGGAGCISCCFFSRIARATSPTLCTFDQSIFGFASASCRAPELPLPPRPFRMWARTRSASSVSMELECVFFSVTPTAVRASRISLLLTSSSRANSLIRTVLIRPRVSSTSHLPLVPHTDS